MISLIQRYGIATGMILLAILAYAIGLNTLELRAEEPRRALVAMEMIFTGDYLAPHTYGLPYYNKPPLFNWAIAAVFLTFDTFDEWAVRLPSILALFATAIAIFLFMKRTIGSTAGWMAALMYLTCADILYYGGINAGEIDLFYTLLIALQTIPVYYIGKGKNSWPLFLWAYGVCALATLTKSVPALIFLALTLLAWLIIEGKWKKLFSLAHFAGIALYLLILGGYFYAYSQQEELSYLLANWLYEGGDKASADGGAGEFVGSFFGFFPRFLKIGLPWTVLLLLLIGRKLRNRIWSLGPARFALIFLLANFWLYWLVIINKERYMYPFFPFLCMHMALIYLEAPLQINKKRLILWIAGLMFAIRIAYSVFVLPAMDKGELSDSYVYKEISSDILAITGDEPVYLLADLDRYSFEAPFTRDTFSWERPGIFPYQIPYYTSRENGRIMRWVKEVQPDRYYLAPAAWLDEHGIAVDPHYRFTEQWGMKEIVLFDTK